MASSHLCHPPLPKRSFDEIVDLIAEVTFSFFNNKYSLYRPLCRSNSQLAYFVNHRCRGGVPRARATGVYGRQHRSGQDRGPRGQGFVEEGPARAVRSDGGGVQQSGADFQEVTQLRREALRLLLHWAWRAGPGMQGVGGVELTKAPCCAFLFLLYSGHPGFRCGQIVPACDADTVVTAATAATVRLFLLLSLLVLLRLLLPLLLLLPIAIVATDVATRAAVTASCRLRVTAMLFFFVSGTLLCSYVRLEIQEILRGFLCTVISLTPEDLVPCVYLACNEVSRRSSSDRMVALSTLVCLPLLNYTTCRIDQNPIVHDLYDLPGISFRGDTSLNCMVYTAYILCCQARVGLAE